MNPRFLLAVLAASCSSLCLRAAASLPGQGLLIGAPDTPPTLATPGDGLHENWGSVRLALAAGSGAADAAVTSFKRASSVPPVVLTESTADGVTLAVSAFRGPAFPQGFDVLDAEIRNGTPSHARVELRLRLPEGAVATDGVVRLGGRAIIALATPPPVLRATGCTTAAEAMPGWARPNVPCHAAFRNIRAGMGGVPIVYQFLMDRQGEARTVALGFCESHWGDVGKRPLVIRVEGTPERRLDPLAEWGQHKPGCVVFKASDADQDGRIDVRVLPAEGAPDRNPILNAIWVFPQDLVPDPADVVAGRADAKALFIVDVGGPGEGPVSTPGKLDLPGGCPTYHVELAPGAQQTLAFLVATGGESVPAWSQTTWTPQALRQAATDVWAGALWTGLPSGPAPSDDDTCAAVADILMCRAQADDFYLALGEPVATPATAFSFAASARLVEALDHVGFCREAERLLRVYWDRPAPGPLASLSQRDDGHWEDSAGRSGPHAQALLALARHASAARDGRWLARAYPAMRAGAEWIRSRRAAAQVAPADAPWCAQALSAAAAAATLAGHAEDAAWMRQEAEALAGAGAADPNSAYAGLGRCVDAANRVLARP